MELQPLQDDLRQAADLAELTEISADRDQRCLLLIAHNTQADAALLALRPPLFRGGALQRSDRHPQGQH